MLQLCMKSKLTKYLNSFTDEYSLIQLKHLFEDVVLANTRGNDVEKEKCIIYNRGLESIPPAQNIFVRTLYSIYLHH
jgi:hypothetical protein